MFAAADEFDSDVVSSSEDVILRTELSGDPPDFTVHCHATREDSPPEVPRLRSEGCDGSDPAPRCVATSVAVKIELASSEEGDADLEAIAAAYG